MTPYTTLFMLTSLDGKISSGAGDARDFDKDLPNVLGPGVLDPYYLAEKRTDYWSCISGKTAVKLGANSCEFIKEKHRCGHIVFDSRKLSDTGVRHIAENCERMYLISDRWYHPNRSACAGISNLTLMRVESINFVAGIWEDLLKDGVTAVTLQTGGDINAAMLRAGLVQRVDLFVAPIIIGGKRTTSLVGGDDFFKLDDVKAGSPRLAQPMVQVWESGLMRLTYDVANALDTDCEGYSL